MDCELLRQVYINLVGEKEPSLQFKQEEVANHAKENSTKLYLKKIILPSKSEISSHSEYLKKEIKKNYF